MNEFYLISQSNSVGDDSLKIKKLDSQSISAIFGGSRRSGWGKTPTSQTFYRDTTAEDYDREFVNRLMNFKPVYELDILLDFHYTNYAKTTNNADKFCKHIEYVVFPLLKNRRESEVQQKLVNNWLQSKSKNTIENNIKKQNLKLEIRDIHSPTQIQINSDNSAQKIEINYSDKDLKEFFSLVVKDLENIRTPESEELKTEIKKTEDKIREGKNVKNRLVIIGELIKDIGINVFANVVASPIYKKLAPLFGL